MDIARLASPRCPPRLRHIASRKARLAARAHTPSRLMAIQRARATPRSLRKTSLEFLESNSIIARMICRRPTATLRSALSEVLSVALLDPHRAGKTTLALKVASSRPSI